MSGHESDGIVGGEGRKELEVAKGNRAVTKGRMVGRGPVGSRRGRGRRDLGRERGVVDTVEFGGWAERRRVNGTKAGHREGSPNYSKWVSSDYFRKMSEWLANVDLGEPLSDEEKAQSQFGIGWAEEAARAEAEACQDFEDREIEDLVDTHSSPVPRCG